MTDVFIRDLPDAVIARWTPMPLGWASHAASTCAVG